jgi:hypothetical protein
VQLCPQTRKKCTSIDQEWCLLMVLVAILTALALLQWTGVLGCRWPILVSASQNIILVWQLRYSAPSPTLAADATANCNMVVLMWKAHFKQMGAWSVGIQSMKKCPLARLRDFSSERYDTSEWMLRIMLDAWKWIFCIQMPWQVV